MKKYEIYGNYFFIEYKVIKEPYFRKVIGENDLDHLLEGINWDDLCLNIIKPFIIAGFIDKNNSKIKWRDLFIDVKVNNRDTLVGIRIPNKQQGQININGIRTAYGWNNKNGTRPIYRVLYVDWNNINDDYKKLIDFNSASKEVQKELIKNKTSWVRNYGANSRQF